MLSDTKDSTILGPQEKRSYLGGAQWHPLRERGAFKEERAKPLPASSCPVRRSELNPLTRDELQDTLDALAPRERLIAKLALLPLAAQKAYRPDIPKAWDSEAIATLELPPPMSFPAVFSGAGATANDTLIVLL